MASHSSDTLTPASVPSPQTHQQSANTNTPNRPTSFYSLSPELRNLIYHYHFDNTTQEVKHFEGPKYQKNQKGRPASIFTPAKSVSSAIQIFRVSPLVYSEARPIFFQGYCREARFSLRTRNSIYSFSRLPTWLMPGIHRIELAATGESQARRMLNPIKIALRDAVRVVGKDDSAVFVRASNALARPNSKNLTWSVNVGLKLGGENVELIIKYLHGGKINIRCTGPIAQLNWNLIPLMRYMERSKGWSRSASAEVLRTPRGQLTLSPRGQLRRGQPGVNAQAEMKHWEMVRAMGEAERELKEALLE